MKMNSQAGVILLPFFNAAILFRAARDGALLSASRREMNSEEKPSARAKAELNRDLRLDNRNTPVLSW